MARRSANTTRTSAASIPQSHAADIVAKRRTRSPGLEPDFDEVVPASCGVGKFSLANPRIWPPDR
jgi:hypothetical protein